MVKCLPAQHPEAAPAADCSSICSLYSFCGGFWLVWLGFIPFSPYLECYPGNYCASLSSLGFVPWGIFALALRISKVPGYLGERMGTRGMCPASPGRMMMDIWGNAWPSPAAAALAQLSPPVWFLPGSPLSAFNPGTRSRFPLRACFTPPFPQQGVREAKPDR